VYLEKPDAHLDPEVAARYDTSHASEFEPGAVDPAIEVLLDLAGDGRAVEFAIGTGRIAVPLSAAGVSVAGIDFSEPMLEQLRAKPEAAVIEAVHGDMTSTVVGDDFAVAYLVFNTIMNLRSQEGQVACFRNAAAHLRPGGRFVIEVMVPEVHRLGSGESIVPFSITDEHLGFDEYIDRVQQILISHHVWTGEGGPRRSSNAFRYVWPAELDLLARLAGMEIEHRWADWHRSAFTDQSPSHISIYRKSA